MNGTSWVVMANDFRDNSRSRVLPCLDQQRPDVDGRFDGGRNDSFTGFIPLTCQSDPGVSFDSAGNSFLSDITGNLILDLNNGYENLDTEISVLMPG